MSTGQLSGLRLVAYWPTAAAAHVGQLFADFGAEVVLIEPPGGSALRRDPAFPFIARGTRSIELDLRAADDRLVAQRLGSEADVVVESFRPGVAERLGVGRDALIAANPALVHASITGFGRSGPYSDLQGYEGLVFAKVGGGHAFAPAANRDGPAFASVPYCTWSAAQTAAQGILVALYERTRTGLGQFVDASLARAIATHDPYGWLFHVLTERYSGAYTAGRPFTDDGQPVSPLPFSVLIALSLDGQWLQFSQVGPRLFRALIRALDLDWIFDEPGWATAPLIPDQADRSKLWALMLERVRMRSAAEWSEIFERDHDLWAEPFRRGPEVLDHPQLLHDGAVVTVTDPSAGLVRQPSSLVAIPASPVRPDRPAPALDADAEALRAEEPRASDSRGLAVASAPRPPLDGVTVLELGIWYAGPYGTTPLTDWGARVIKIESLEGDPLRTAMPLPEVGGAKTLQGKQSIAVDLRTPEGRRIVHELASRAHLVLQSFRAGAAERAGVDAASLRAVNPELVYLHAPGYGIDGPCGDRPAFAPTIGAATGLATRNLGPSLPDGADLDEADVQRTAYQLATVNFGAFASSDGLSALGNTTALLLGLVGRALGCPATEMSTSMLRTVSHVMADDIIDYPDKQSPAQVDAELHGFHALYRLYRASSGWIFLAAPLEKEWQRLGRQAESDAVALLTDPRFATSSDRRAHDAELIEVLQGWFHGRTAIEWEARLRRADVGCVAVTEQLPEAFMQSDEFGRAHEYLVDVAHPTYGEHPRLGPHALLSRSPVTPGAGCLHGEHTVSILGELGYGADTIDDLRARGVIAP